MGGEILLFLTLSGLWSLSSCEALRKVHYVTEKMSWIEAQSYCRNNYDDLASLLSMEDITSLLKNRELHMDRPNSEFAWIGLKDDMGIWMWSLNGTGHHEDTHYSNWDDSQPNYRKGTLTCTFMKQDGYWWDSKCYGNLRRSVVCYNGSAYFLQNTKRTWFEAQEHCREKSMDLASVMGETENKEIAKKLEESAMLASAWIEKATTQARLKVKISSRADMNDPEVQRQLLQQVHAMLEKKGMSDFKLRWTQRDGNIFHKESKKKN